MDWKESKNNFGGKMNEEKDKKIKELEKEIIRLQKELSKTKKEFEEFRAKHQTTVDELKKALKIKSSSKKKTRPSGAKNGHIAYTRKIPERIDKIKTLNIKKCPDCNSKLSETQEIRFRHVTDIALTSKVINTKYNIHRKYCKKCKKIVEQELSNVLPNARFGLNLMLLIMYLKLGLRLSGNKVCEFLLTMYDIKISEGEIIHILTQLTREFGDYYSHLEKIVRLARVKHTDSTSWRVDGKNYFAWVFIASGAVIYKISKRNNHKVALTLFGKNQKGKVLTVDRHSAFRTLAVKRGFVLQLCWSHITEDSKELAKNYGAEAKYVHKKLKEIYAVSKTFEGKGTDQIVEQLLAEIFQLTIKHYKSQKVWRFVQNLYYRDGENLFRFVTDPEISPTNNISERELRDLVLIRKTSNGSRSHRGANATATLLSVVHTLRLNKKNVLTGLREIINNPSGY